MDVTRERARVRDLRFELKGGGRAVGLYPASLVGSYFSVQKETVAKMSLVSRFSPFLLPPHKMSIKEE